MGKEDQLPFKVGQSAEAQSFENGFRGAWFRCKIQKISCRKGHWNALLEYFDYPDEKLTWTKLYQNPPYNVGKVKEKTQLMLRPQYPLVKVKTEVSNFSSTSETTVVVDGNWQAGDLVDWWANGCYWSGHLTKLLGNNEAEDGVRRCAQLVQPVNRALHSMSTGRTGYSSDLSFSIHSTANLSPASDDTDLAERPLIIDLPKEAAVNTLKKVRQSDICSSSHTGDESTKESFFSDKGSGSCTGVDLAKTTAGPTENFSYSSCPLKKFRTSDGVQLHSTGSDTTEAAILDLEELVNKIKWLKGLLELGKPMSNVAIPSWKFVEHHASFGNK
ncbi:uncharacterized protein [Solanum lycopersicum]|uniref:uncharacterized protein isoform X3 n=1 Tax=Solanum lycopersicum TaxID=4081 RepID=UPI003747C486